MSYHMSALGRHHNRQAFDCGIPALNGYLHTLARQHQERNISKTFVATATLADSDIVGYYTLASGQIHYQALPLAEKHPRYPVSVVRLARLAVDVRHQGKGVGGFLLYSALKQVAMVAGNIGVYAVVVDAKDAKAADFYQHYGFMPLTTCPLTLYLPVKTIEQI